MVCRLNSLSSSSLIRAHTPSPNSVPLGTTTAARARTDASIASYWRAGAVRPQLPHDELEEEQRGFGGLFVFGEIALDAFLLLAAEGRVGEDDVHAVALADVGELEAKGVAGVNLRRVEAVQQQVHLAEQIRQRLGFAAEERAFLQDAAVGHGLDLLGQMVVRLDQEAAGAAGGVEHGLAQARIGHGDHEAHDGARGVELAGIARRIAHLAQHGFVERAEGVQLVAGGEVDAVELVDDVAQQVAADHAVLHAAKHRGDDIAPIVAVGAGERAQVAEQPRALLAVRQRAFLLVDEGQQFVAGDAVGLGGPIAPAVRRLDGRLELLPGEPGLPLALEFQVIEELQEHDPGEHRQAVQIAVQTLVLPHDVPGGFEKCAQVTEL